MSVGALVQNISFSKSIERWDENKKKRKRGEGKEREKMFWFIFMADFISGNPVQQNLMEEEMPSSYFNSIITTLMQVNINACQINELNCDFEIDRLDIGLT